MTKFNKVVNKGCKKWKIKKKMLQTCAKSCNKWQIRRKYDKLLKKSHKKQQTSEKLPQTSVKTAQIYEKKFTKR